MRKGWIAALTGIGLTVLASVAVYEGVKAQSLSPKTGLSVEDFVHQTWVTSVDARHIPGASRSRLRIS